MAWSLKIFRIAGINVYLHWTFILIMAWIILASLSQGEPTWEALMPVWAILSLFGCVLLHEFGHALQARKYKITTERITLLPIGGVASLEKMPEKPGQELLVALAGPAVNLAIAAILGVYILASGMPFHLFPLFEDISLVKNWDTYISILLKINAILFLFNLIPAFPMDGGRVLRAFLAMRYSRAEATNIAARIGQFLAIGFVFIGIMTNFWLIFIGLFIYLGASGEANYEAQRSLLSNLRVQDVLMHQFTPLHAWETIGQAIETLLDGQEKDFLVTEDNVIIGTLSRDDIIKGLHNFGKEERIKRIMNPDWTRLAPEMSLNEAFEEMTRLKRTICPVYDKGELIGVLNQENIMEAIMIESARANAFRTQEVG